MENNRTIDTIMTTNVITVEMDDNIWEVEKTFRINHLRHAPVCDEGKVVGMISLMDIRRNLIEEVKISENAANAFKAGNIMTPEPITLQISQPIKEAAQIFVDNDFHALPVMDGYDLAGIISTTDVIKYLLSEVE